MLRATTACTFSTSQLPKVVRESCVLHILTSKCASHHNGVQFFISHLASWLCTRRFSEPTFRPSRATHHWNYTSESPLLYLFAHLHLLSSHPFSVLIFSLLLFSFLSLWLFPPLLFHLPTLSEVWLLNFLRISVVGWDGLILVIHTHTTLLSHALSPNFVHRQRSTFERSICHGLKSSTVAIIICHSFTDVDTVDHDFIWLYAIWDPASFDSILDYCSVSSVSCWEVSRRICSYCDPPTACSHWPCSLLRSTTARGWFRFRSWPPAVTSDLMRSSSWWPCGWLYPVVLLEDEARTLSEIDWKLLEAPGSSQGWSQ